MLTLTSCLRGSIVHSMPPESFSDTAGTVPQVGLVSGLSIFPHDAIECDLEEGTAHKLPSRSGEQITVQPVTSWGRS